MTTIIVMTMTLKKLILTLAANTIQHHRGPWKTCKVSSLKVPVSARRVTGNTWNVNDISDISRTGTAKNSNVLLMVRSPGCRICHSGENNSVDRGRRGRLSAASIIAARRSFGVQHSEYSTEYYYQLSRPGGRWAAKTPSYNTTIAIHS